MRRASIILKRESSGGFIRCGAATSEWLPQRPNVAVSIRDRYQYPPVLHLFQADLVLSQAIPKVIFAVAGRAQADQDRKGIARVVIAVGCM